MGARHILVTGLILAAFTSGGCGSTPPPDAAPPPGAPPPPGGSPPPGAPPPPGTPPPGALPPPDRATAEAYVADLRRIDPAIVGDGDLRTLVDHGLHLCESIKQQPGDQTALVRLAGRRFTAPGHPDGFGEVPAARILAVVRERICPGY